MRLAWGALGAALALSGCLLDGDGNETTVGVEDVCAYACECQGLTGDGLEACTTECVGDIPPGLLSPDQIECLLEASCLQLNTGETGCFPDDGGM